MTTVERARLAAESSRWCVLHRLCLDQRSLVRAKAAGNGSLHRASQEVLSGDSSPWVRRRLAGNEVCSASLLVRLLLDPEDVVRRAAARNRSLPRALVPVQLLCADVEVEGSASDVFEVAEAFAEVTHGLTPEAVEVASALLPEWAGTFGELRGAALILTARP